MNFKEKWFAAVDKKNSVLCVGADPAEFAMGRGGEGLPENVIKRDWSLKYIEAVAPFCAAIKPNSQFWLGRNDMETLYEIGELAKSLDIPLIEDRKPADIGSTNDAGFFYTMQRADAVTLAPFAGNMGEAAKQTKARNLGLIAMCIMSNKEYAREKLKLVPVADEVGTYHRPDIMMTKVLYSNLEIPHVFQYVQLAHDAANFGLEGVVIGAPSKDNHIKPEEIAAARRYVGDNMLVLLPGVGKQGGEAGIIWQYFAPKNVVVNASRALMFPKEQNSTPQEQADIAKFYQGMLNDLRGKAA